MDTIPSEKVNSDQTPPVEALPKEEAKQPEAPKEEPKGIPYDQYHKKLERIKELEKENEELKSSALSENDEVLSEEGKALEKQIDTLKSELSDIKAINAKKDVLISHPILKEKWEEFEEFRNLPDNKGMNLKTAAKAYLVENGLLDNTARKGLEKPTGGSRLPPTSGISVDDVATLRKTNFKLYIEKLKSGELNTMK